MIIKEITDRTTEKEFINFPRILYKGDENFVALFDRDVRAAFNRDTNVHFQNGDAKRWVLKNDSGNVIGRIAAFYEKDKAIANSIPGGGCGFFECINSQEAANLLFDTAAEWLKKQGLEAMDGPVNFGENESNWGCLVHGFMPQGYGMAYNKPYYRDLFENYGFQLYFRQFSFHIDLDKPFPERFWKIAEWINKRPGYTFKHFNYQDADQFVSDLVKVYNEAWPLLREDFTPLDPKSVYESLEKARPILDPELNWFAYYKDEPIAFFTFFPDANQIFRHLNGKLHLLNQLRFLYLKKRKVITRMRGNTGGVSPKYQNSGVESGIIYRLKQIVDSKPQYKQAELSWVGDFNPKMIALYQAAGAYHAKTHHTYRYMINKKIPFKRFMPDQVNESKLPRY
jgi:hypothetical protein